MQADDKKVQRKTFRFLHKQLTRAKVPPSLEKNIRDNWHAQMDAEKSKRPNVSRLGLAVAASVFVAFLALLTVFQQGTPNIVELAINDIAVDMKRNVQPANSLVDSLRVQLKPRGINAPLSNMPIKLAKYCTLDKTRTLHLRIAGSAQGEVHFFIRDKASSDEQSWPLIQGEKANMVWQIIQPRDGLTVLVMRTIDMNQQKVEELVKHMFYA